MTADLLPLAASKLAISVALAVLALGAQRLRARPQVTHALWLLVLVTLLVPSIVALPVPALAWNAGGPDDAFSQAVAALQVSVASDATVPGVPGPSWTAALAAVWLAGTAAMLVWTAVRAVRFHRFLARAATPAPEPLRALSAAIAAELGLRAPPVVHTIDARVSPLVWWVGGDVRVVIPSALLPMIGGEPLRLILAHEFAHVRRHDHVVRWIEWLACVLFWWNPAVWVARRELRRSEELCCDAMVLSTAHASPRRYAQSILAVVEFLSVPRAVRPPALAIAAADAGRLIPLTERLEMIVQHPARIVASRWTRSLVRLAAAVVLPLGALHLSPVNAQEVAKVAGAQDPCTVILANIKPAIAQGQITEEQGRLLTVLCERRHVEMAHAREVHAAEGVQKIAEHEVHLKAIESARTIEARARHAEVVHRAEREAAEIKNMVADGVLTHEHAAARMEELKVREARARDLEEVRRVHVEGDVREVRLQEVRTAEERGQACSAALEKIHAALVAGTMTAQQVIEKVAALNCTPNQ